MLQQSLLTENSLITRMTKIEEKLDIVKADVSTLKSDVKTLKSDVSTLKSDVKTLKSDVTQHDSCQAITDLNITKDVPSGKRVLGSSSAV